MFLNVIAVDPGVVTGWFRGSVWVRSEADMGAHVDAMALRIGKELSYGKDHAATARRMADYVSRYRNKCARAVVEGVIPPLNGRRSDEPALSVLDPAFRMARQMAVGTITVVIEDFSLHSMKSTGIDGIAPVRVGRYLAGMLDVMDVHERAAQVAAGVRDPDDSTPVYEVVWYYPGQRGARATSDERLRRWGLWEIGSDHVRDAAKLWAHHVRMARGKTSES